MSRRGSRLPFARKRRATLLPYFQVINVVHIGFPSDVISQSPDARKLQGVGELTWPSPGIHKLEGHGRPV